MLCRQACEECAWRTCNFHPSYPLMLELIRRDRDAARAGRSERRR